jgi:hypothetical protein
LLRRAASKVLRELGFSVTRIHRNADQAPGYTLYRYVRPDGSFDYERYRAVQQAGNKAKLKNIWVIEQNIAFLADYIRRRVPHTRFGICHGTRRGKEQEWFSKYLGCEVIGTEISETATQFPNTIQWDFHEVKPEWIDSVDFIYSNSFDHSYDPAKCLDAWMSCVRPGGVCILEHASQHEADQTSELDPFGADFVQMPFLIATWGKGRYGVREIIEGPAKSHGASRLHFIVIQRFDQ